MGRLMWPYWISEVSSSVWTFAGKSTFSSFWVSSQSTSVRKVICRLPRSRRMVWVREDFPKVRRTRTSQYSGPSASTVMLLSPDTGVSGRMLSTSQFS